jgi:hypothetical protein
MFAAGSSQFCKAAVLGWQWHTEQAADTWVHIRVTSAFPSIANDPKSQSDIASKPLPKSSASSSQYDVVPKMIIRSSNVRPREFAIGDAKRLLQHYP